MLILKCLVSRFGAIKEISRALCAEYETIDDIARIPKPAPGGAPAESEAVQQADKLEKQKFSFFKKKPIRPRTCHNHHAYLAFKFQLYL